MGAESGVAREKVNFFTEIFQPFLLLFLSLMPDNPSSMWESRL